MDKTNRIVKNCRRMDEIEYILACTDQSERIVEDLSNEMEDLTIEYEILLRGGLCHHI